MLRALARPRQALPLVKRQSRWAATIPASLRYERKTPIEHILLRPGMYVGPKDPTRVSTWIYDPEARHMVKANVEYVPALFKVFDEILVNAADNCQRDRSTSLISVDIDPGGPDRPPRISICNDGRGIPVQMHKKEGIYIPELVFGHLLTGSNFDDSEGRLTGGRHGYGAKLANIFSKTFRVETVDSAAGLKYAQAWRNNMRERGEPEVTALSDGGGAGANASTSGSSNNTPGDYTRVTFEPDLDTLGISGGCISSDDVALMRRRVVDIAGCSAPVRVVLDGEPVAVSGFEEYVRLYVGGGGSGEGASEADSGSSSGGDFGSSSSAVAGSGRIVCAKINSRWDIAVAPSPDGQPQQISFVNGMATPRGGTHVTLVANQLAKKLAEMINKRFPDLEVTAAAVRPHLFLFVRAMVENPSFDSQMKEGLTTRASDFGSTCVLTAKFLRSVFGDSGVAERVVETETEKMERRLKRQAAAGGPATGKRRQLLLNVAKLEDAHKAGSSEGRKCTLILTEGDSAKALAVAGLEVVGRQHFGVFPLRGKFINVREAGMRQIAANVEVQRLCTILGLDFDKSYETGPDASMRYGRVMLMADQDHDGSHIKGLLINFFHRFWPNLLAHEGFLLQFVTPILKASPKGGGGGSSISSAVSSISGEGKRSSAVRSISSSGVVVSGGSASGGAKKGAALPFFSVPEFEEWRRRQGISAAEFVRRWSVKYYKGLGTSTSAEARQYFGDLSRHVKTFDATSHADGESIEMAFSRSRAAERRDWLLTRYRADAYLPTAAEKVKISDFVNTELIQFSHADNVRSIPSALDGLKPSQRKVLFACFKRKLRSEIKVAQLAGYVSEHTAYHHGEASLASTIVSMAQDFVGSNNAPLLQASGQFGTRGQGGKDSASPRYLFTHLSRLARLLFPEEDDALLARRDDDGAAVEPFVYMPVIPLLLVNGSQGIGTGWSTGIPSHNPLDVLDNTERLINGLPPLQMVPWVRGYRGRIRLAPPAGKPAEAAAAAASTSTSTLPAAAAADSRDAEEGGGEEIEALLDESDPEIEELLAEANAEIGAAADDEAAAASGGGLGAASAYLSKGIMTRHGVKKVTVTELPVGKWTSDYKEVLVRLAERGIIRSFKEAHTQSSVRFELQLEPLVAEALSDKRLFALLRLASSHSVRNMHAFSSDGRIERFTTAVELLEHGYAPRLELYRRRRQRLIATKSYALKYAANRERFVQAVRSGALSIMGKKQRSRKELESQLQELGFEPLSRLTSERDRALPPLFGAPQPSKEAGGEERENASEGEGFGASGTTVNEVAVDAYYIGVDAADDAAVVAASAEMSTPEEGLRSLGGDTMALSSDEQDAAPQARDFDYLLDMTLASFTSERLTQLRRDVENAEETLTAVTASRPEELWLSDLAELRKELLKDPEYQVNRNPEFVALGTSTTNHSGVSDSDFASGWNAVDGQLESEETAEEDAAAAV